MKRAVKYGKIRQSLVFWCLNGTEWKWDHGTGFARRRRTSAAKVSNWFRRNSGRSCVRYGLPAARHREQRYAADPPFHKGVNNPRYHDEVISRTKHTIDQCAAFGIPNVIAFTGYKWHRRWKIPRAAKSRYPKLAPPIRVNASSRNLGTMPRPEGLPFAWNNSTRATIRIP